MRQRDYLQKKAHTTGLPSDWKRYRSQRNWVTNLIRKEKENYNRRLINENAGDPNSFWWTVKKILLSKSKEPLPKLKVDGQVITEKSSIANSFNNVFVNTAINLCKSFINAALNLSSSISLTRAMTSTFLFTDISESTVLSEIWGLKSGKAVGLDNIPPRLLKDASAMVTKPITAIVNASLSQSKVPDDWKAAYVIPLFKKGRKDNVDNYHPISILPTISELLEWVVHTQLISYLQENRLLSPFQCGFHKQHSTTFAALSFADTIRQNIDQGFMMGAVFVDLRKAFDTIDHSILLRELHFLGIKGKERNWFENYLSGRTQVVGIGGASSDPLHITSGVPQCSILGPLLFVIHINDLPLCIKICNVLMYAADTFCFVLDITLKSLKTVRIRAWIQWVNGF